MQNNNSKLNIILSVLLIFLAGFGIWFLVKNDKNKQAELRTISYENITFSYPGNWYQYDETGSDSGYDPRYLSPKIKSSVSLYGGSETDSIILYDKYPSEPWSTIGQEVNLYNSKRIGNVVFYISQDAPQSSKDVFNFVVSSASEIKQGQSDLMFVKGKVYLERFQYQEMKGNTQYLFKDTALAKRGEDVLVFLNDFIVSEFSCDDFDCVKIFPILDEINSQTKLSFKSKSIHGNRMVVVLENINLKYQNPFDLAEFYTDRLSSAGFKGISFKPSFETLGGGHD